MRSRSLAADLPAAADSHVASRGLTAVVLLCFLLSGATSLVLEGALIRLLRFSLGNTTLAVTTVLCAFMAGLALGSYVAGRLCDRTSRLLRMYGILEGAVGVCCLLLPVCILALEPVYRSMYGHLADWPLVLSLARFLLCGLLLLIPSTFMGATLPVLTRWHALRFGRIGRSVAGLYAINSTGAAVGAMLGGFLLLPGLGVNWTLRLACAVNIVICVLMLLIDRRQGGAAAEPVAEASPRVKAKVPDALSPAWQTGLLLAYGLSGAAALIYEVTWTRALALVIGSTTYAFSLMLTAFILGLAIGSAIMARLVDRLSRRMHWFAGVEIGIGLSAIAALPLFGLMPVWVVGIVREHRESFAAMQSIEFGLILLVMMVPTTLMGAAFPLVSRASASSVSRLGRSVGSVYAANTVGGIAGAFVASFLLIPHLGTQVAILVAVAINVLIGVAVLSLLPGGNWPRRAIPAAAGILFIVFAFASFPRWDPSVMASGAYLYADSLASQAADPASIRSSMRANKLIFHREDMCTTVTVRDDITGARTLSVGGKVDASTAEDVSTQLLLAHAPLLLHPRPQSALVIGLASGMTLGAAACHDLQRIDCAEISPAVVEGCGFFKDHNGGVLADPRVRLILADGRNHLALAPDSYDVIISEPSNPWIAGVADLFTREFFEICRHRLNPQGIACVWLQAYQMDEPIFRSVVRTFADVFPHAMIVEAVPLGDYLLIGSAEPFGVRYSAMANRLGSSKVAADLKRVGIVTPVDFLRRIVMSDGLAAYAGQATLHTDDNALLEFAAPRGLYRAAAWMSVMEGLSHYRKVNWSFLAGDETAASGLRETLDSRVQAQKLAVEALLRQRRGQPAEAHALAVQAAALDPAGPELLNGAARSILASAEVARRQGDKVRALEYYAQAANLAPRFFDAQMRSGETLAAARQWSRAAQAFRRAVSIQPDDVTALDDLAWLLATCPDETVRSGREAVEWAQRLCRVTGDKDALSLRTLAAAQAEAGRFEEAVRLAQDALELASLTKQTDLVAALEQELPLYRQGKPYHSR
jgi:spermidine synthase